MSMISSACQSHSDLVYMNLSKNVRLQLRARFGQNIYQGNERQEMNPRPWLGLSKRKTKRTGKADRVRYFFAFGTPDFRGRK